MHSARRQARACMPLLAALLALCAAASTTAAPGQEAHVAGTRVVRGRPAARTHDLVRGLGAARRVRGAALPRQFLYVYEMPPEFTEDAAALPVQWHPEQYDFDQARAAAQLGAYSGRASCVAVHWHSVQRGAEADVRSNMLTVLLCLPCRVHLLAYTYGGDATSIIAPLPPVCLSFT